MEIPLWKKAISYLYPLVLKTYQSQYSGRLEIGLQDGKIVLDTANVNYSFGSLHKVFDKAIKNIIFDTQKTYKTLILGFGVGSIAQVLQKKQAKFDITGIEIDDKIIELGEKYFKTKNIPNCHIIAENAIDFLKKDSGSYDLIFVDLFIDDKVPPTFKEVSFLKKIKSKISENGHLMMNDMFVKNERKEILKRTLEQCSIYMYLEENTIFHFHNKH
ncbi:MAG: spermidine synthase [Chitinophagales bacterium]